MKTIRHILLFNHAAASLRLACLITLCLAAILPAGAQQRLQSGARATDICIDRLRDSVWVTFRLDIDSLEVRSNGAVVLMPSLKNGSREWPLPAVEVVGRKHALYAERNGGSIYADADTRIVAKQKGNNLPIDYRAALSYADGMGTLQLCFREDLCGCGERDRLAETDRPLAQADVDFHPALTYLAPKAETVKARCLSGEAYLDFPVNRTEIHPDYRRNPAELGKIRATIDTVRRNPKDYRITRITLRGYASPEGTYALNTRLSSGRTEAVRRYLVDCYNFADTLFSLSHEPENWAGLRRYVEQSGLSDKTDILALIDRTDLQPDAKELELRTRHPQSYRLLLQECYPGLRRTDYRVDYVIRGFDVEEAKALVRTRPQDLSLQELFLVAQTYRPGSADFKQVFDVAVRMYPADPVANLNAANALLEQRLPEQALRYLDLAPACPEAQNARAVALILLRRYDEALPLLQAASSAGLQAAKTNIRILQLNDNQ